LPVAARRQRIAVLPVGIVGAGFHVPARMRSINSVVTR